MSATWIPRWSIIRPLCQDGPAARQARSGGEVSRWSGGVVVQEPGVVLVVEGREELAEAVDGVRQGAGGEQHGLVARDVVLPGAHGDEVPVADLGLAERPELAERRQEAGAPRLRLTVLVEDAELE